MIYPIEVNISITDDKGEENIAAAVIDFHYSVIYRIIRTYDGRASILTPDGFVKIFLSYDEVVDIYKEQVPISDTFKDEVDEYKKDNYKPLKRRLKK